MPESTPSAPTGEREGLRWNAWNLLLLVPLLIMVTPWWNSIQPTFLGLPFFYWIQFVFVFVGVGAVWIVYAMTRDEKTPAAAGTPLDVDQLDEGAGLGDTGSDAAGDAR